MLFVVCTEGVPNVVSNSSVDLYDDPFHGLDDILGSNVISENTEKPNEEPVDDSDDSDFEVDEYNQVVDVEVDMTEFQRHIDHGVESIGRLTENSAEVDTDINPEIGGLNFSDFESGSGSDDEN